MPGFGRTQFVFKDATPWIVKVVMVLLFTNLLGAFAVDLWVEHFAPSLPTAACSFAIQIKPGVIGFVPSWVGTYEHSSFWTHFAIFGLLILIFGWYGLKGQVVRVK